MKCKPRGMKVVLFPPSPPWGAPAHLPAGLAPHLSRPLPPHAHPQQPARWGPTGRGGLRRSVFALGSGSAQPCPCLPAAHRGQRGPGQDTFLRAACCSVVTRGPGSRGMPGSSCTRSAAPAFPLWKRLCRLCSHQPPSSRPACLRGRRVGKLRTNTLRRQGPTGLRTDPRSLYPRLQTRQLPEN